MESSLPFRTALVHRRLLLGVAVIAIISGCKKPEGIREYTVAKPALPVATHRMLAAIVPEEKPANDASNAGTVSESEKTGAKKPPGARAWFFKLVGPIPAVEQAASAFDQFVASIRIGKGARPEWTLPEGWKEDPADRSPDFGREATIRIGEEGSLELTVSKLPMPSERRESWTLGNINRWREQLKLPAIARSELDEYTDEIKAGEETAIKVDFRGAFSGPPMAGRMAAAKAAHESAGVTAADAGTRSASTGRSNVKAPSGGVRPLPFDAEVPAEWKPGRLNEFRVAAFDIEGDDGSRAAEMTVTPLGPGSGDLRRNVDRWRGEIKLPAATPAELEEQTKTIEIDGQKADYVHLVGPEDSNPREATLGVIVRRPEVVWFFKLRGQPDVVEREKERFEEYVKSVKFK